MRPLEESDSRRQKVRCGHWGWGDGWGAFRGTEFQSGDMKTVQEVGAGDGCTIRQACLMPLNFTFKHGEDGKFRIVQIKHNKKGKKEKRKIPAQFWNGGLVLLESRICCRSNRNILLWAVHWTHGPEVCVIVCHVTGGAFKIHEERALFICLQNETLTVQKRKCKKPQRDKAFRENPGDPDRPGVRTALLSMIQTQKPLKIQLINPIKLQTATFLIDTTF